MTEIGNLEYSVATSFHEFLAVYEPWARAFDSGQGDGCITNSPAWSYGLWFRHAVTPVMKVLVVWRGDRLILAFPYVEERTWKGTRIHALAEIVPFYCIETEPATFQFLWRTLSELYRNPEIRL